MLTTRIKQQNMTMKVLKTAVLICALATVAVSQEFTVPTPKGNLIVKVTANRMELGSFKMQGTITNTTAWDLTFLRLRVIFYDHNGNEFSGLCPREPDGAVYQNIATEKRRR